MIEAQAERATGRHAAITVYDKEGRLQVVAEVKSRIGVTAEWAAQLRRNLTMQGLVPHAPFFLLALPDHFYLWRRASDRSAAIPPDYDADAAPLLAPYLDDDLRLSGRLSGAGLLLAVTSWLSDLVAIDVDGETLPAAETWLIESELYPAIKGGSVES